MRNKICAWILGLALLASIVYAQDDSRDVFEKEPTALNLEKIDNPSLEDFNRLKDDNEKKAYLSRNYKKEFAADYLEKLGIFNNINSDSKDIQIANRYFSDITGIGNVNLAEGSVRWDGKILRNGQTEIKVGSLNGAGISSMVSTQNSIKLITVQNSEIDIKGDNFARAFEMESSANQRFMIIDGQRYPVVANSNLEVSYDFYGAKIANSGETIEMSLDRDLNVRNEPGIVMRLEKATLMSGGSITTQRIDQHDISVTNGEAEFLFQNLKDESSYYGLRYTVSSNGNIPVDIKIADDISLLKKDTVSKTTAFLLNPGQWGGSEEANGLIGSELTAVYKERSGFLCVGGGLTCQSLEVNSNGISEIGAIGTRYTTTDFSGNPSSLYFREGITPNKLAEQAQDKSILRLPLRNQNVNNFDMVQLSDAMKSGNFEPFNAEISRFTVTEEGNIGRTTFYGATDENPSLSVSESRQGLGRTSAMVISGSVNSEGFSNDITVLPSSYNVEKLEFAESAEGPLKINADIKFEDNGIRVSADMNIPGENTKGDFLVNMEGERVVVDGSFLIESDTSTLNCEDCIAKISPDGTTELTIRSGSFEDPTTKIKFARPTALTIKDGTIIIPENAEAIVTQQGVEYKTAIQSGLYKRENGNIIIPATTQTAAGSTVPTNIIIATGKSMFDVKSVEAITDVRASTYIRESLDKLGPAGIASLPIAGAGEIGRTFTETTKEIPVLNKILAPFNWLIEKINPIGKQKVFDSESGKTAG